MKTIRLFLLATLCLTISTGIIEARLVLAWSYQELLDRSDLVVIATPTATNDTEENIDFPGFDGQRVTGVETRFSVSAVLKGDNAVDAVALHHYRVADNAPHVPNGPMFVAFEPPKNPIFNAVRETPPVQRQYILFLVREPDGRYAPVVGQTDPAIAIQELVAISFPNRNDEDRLKLPEPNGLHHSSDGQRPSPPHPKCPAA